MDAQIPHDSFDLTKANGISELEAQIQCELSGQVSDLRLVVGSNGVILRGNAHTYHAKQQAQQVVNAATTLPVVANEIEII
jgi:hypothetical protein